MKKAIFLMVKRTRKAPDKILLTILLGGVLMWGCATTSAPRAILDAEEAVQQAQEAQAQRYAALNLSSAEELLQKAQEYLEKKEYEKALALAEESKQKAKKAGEEALQAQEKFKKEAIKLLEEADKEITLKKEDKTASAITLRNLGFAQETFKRAKFAFDSKRYEEAGDLAILSKNQALGLLEAIKQAERESAKKEKKSLEALNQGITTYKVKPGETLWMIAGYSEIYDDSLLWPLIYKANRDQIRDPEVIFTDQTLKIPRNITEEQRSMALKEAAEGTWFKHDSIRDNESSLLKKP